MNQDEMTQDEINQAEWENPANWSLGSKLFCVYFSQKDARTWVPKRYPWMGSTMNLGRLGGVLWLTDFLVGIPGLIILFSLIVLGK